MRTQRKSYGNLLFRFIDGYKLRIAIAINRLLYLEEFKAIK